MCVASGTSGSRPPSLCTHTMCLAAVLGRSRPRRFAPRSPPDGLMWGRLAGNAAPLDKHQHQHHSRRNGGDQWTRRRRVMRAAAVAPHPRHERGLRHPAAAHHAHAIRRKRSAAPAKPRPHHWPTSPVWPSAAGAPSAIEALNTSGTVSATCEQPTRDQSTVHRHCRRRRPRRGPHPGPVQPRHRLGHQAPPPYCRHRQPHGRARRGRAG